MEEESSDSDDEQSILSQLSAAEKRQFTSTAPPLPPLPPVPDKVIVKKYDPKLGECESLHCGTISEKSSILPPNKNFSRRIFILNTMPLIVLDDFFFSIYGLPVPLKKSLVASIACKKYVNIFNKSYLLVLFLKV